MQVEGLVRTAVEQSLRGPPLVPDAMDTGPDDGDANALEQDIEAAAKLVSLWTHYCRHSCPADPSLPEGSALVPSGKRLRRPLHVLLAVWVSLHGQGGTLAIREGVPKGG